jgi:hypothetical protein
MKKIQEISVDGRTYRATIVNCDKCGSEIRVGREAFLVRQTAVTLVHADGASPLDEIVHENNEPAGCFEYLCKACSLTKGKLSRRFDPASEKVLAALKRQKELYPDIFAVKESQADLTK